MNIRTAITTTLMALTTSAFAHTSMVSPSKYPVVCTDDAGKVTLVADGRKVRVAYWDNDKPYFTDSNPASPHKRTFPAPAGSVCRFAEKPAGQR